MTHTLRILFEDLDGSLSPIVDEAIKAGATADRDASNVADNSFNVTFKDKRQSNAFKAKLPEWALVSDDAVEDVVEVVPVEPEAETPAE